MNIFLEDDEELKDKDEELDDDDKKKKKKDDDDDDSSSSGNDYLDDFDTNDDDDSDDSEDDYSGNDYISDEEDSTDSEDYEEDDDDSDTDSDGSYNDYIGDSEGEDYQSSGEGYGNKLAKLAHAIVVAKNNFHHVHLMCAGKKFDTVHRMTEDLMNIVYYWVDTVAEMALEDDECELDNFCNSARYVSEMPVESEKTYDYESACTAVSETLRKLVNIMTETRNSIDKSHVQSKLDEYLVTLNKEFNFLMKRRMKNVDESATFNSFI